MPASFPANMVNHDSADSGIPFRFRLFGTRASFRAQSDMEGRMGVRFVDKLVIAGLAGSVAGVVPLPTGAAPAPANTEPGTPIFKQLFGGPMEKDAA
jgi:hypothetical protein